MDDRPSDPHLVDERPLGRRGVLVKFPHGPGSSPIETPAIPLEIGNCTTVASLATLLPITFASDFSSSNLKVGNSFPESRMSGTLFMKLGSPASARLVPTRESVVAAARAAAPVRKSRRWKLGKRISLLEEELRTPSLHWLMRESDLTGRFRPAPPACCTLGSSLGPT
jgi:hypothetical protein